MDCYDIKEIHKGEQKMKYKLLIFDMDGTILDTLQDLCTSTNYALQLNGMPSRTIEEVCSFVGNGIRKLIERAVPHGTDNSRIDEVFESFKTHYAEHCADTTKPYDGILDLLTTLKSKGYLTAVVSNKADFGVQSLCDGYFPGMFDYAVGEREGIRRKPAPDSVEEVLLKLGIQKKEAVYIGDSEVDIQTAKNAGIDEIAVSWGFRKEAFLMEQGAAIIVQKPAEILNMV